MEEKIKKYVSDNNQLMSEWNWERNLAIEPSKITLGAHTKVWWKCRNGHEWQAILSNRNKGRGCPYCSGRYAVKGENDLETVNSSLAKEWDYENNNGLTPMDVMPNSHKKVWWKCSIGHKWNAAIDSRNRGNGCPQCAKRQAQKNVHNID